MKKLNGFRQRPLSVPVALIFLCVAFPCSLLASTEFFVAPQGKDTSSGSKRRPFATLARARDAVRELKSKKGLPKGGVTIYLRAGEYNLPETFTLTPQDSGTAEAPITYAAYKDEDARVVSKRTISGWKPLAAPWPAGLPAAAQGKVFVADIPKGWRFHFLYVNDASQPVAKSTQSGDWRQWKRLQGSDKPGPEGRRLKFAAGQPLADIPSNGDAELALITAMWWNIVAPITQVDSATGTAMLQSRCTVEYADILAYWGGFYNIRNALPVLDEVGEWVVDSANGRVYYWPADGTMDGKTVFAPVLHELVRLQGDEEEQRWTKQVEYVTITGLRFMYSDRTPENEYDPKWLTRNGENPDAMVYFQGVGNCTFDNNVIAYSGSQGLALDHFAQNITITRNEIAYNSSGGIQITGYGPGDVDVNKNHLIERNYIHHLGLDYMHSGAVSIYGSHSNMIRYNWIADCPYACVSIVGMMSRYMNDPKLVDTTDSYGSQQSMFQARWTELEQHRPIDNTTMRQYLHSGFNTTVSNICDNYMQKMEDGGALYTWEAGTNNVWLSNVGERTSKRIAGCTLYMDDDTAFNTCSNNTFWTPGHPISDNSHNNSNIWRDNEIGPNKPARYDAARKAILDVVRVKGIWRNVLQPTTSAVTSVAFVPLATPPAGCPFEPSAKISGVEFTGRHAEYTQADTWYPSWGADGRLYSPFTDGSVNGVRAWSIGGGAVVGHAIIEGDDPLALKVIEPAAIPGNPAPYEGRYPCGNLYYNGVWYIGTYGLANGNYPGYNWPIMGPCAGFHISSNNGKAWTPSPLSCAPGKSLFPEPAAHKGPVMFGSPHFVDFGKNMEHSPDGKAYLVAHGSLEQDGKERNANLSWITGDQIYLCRVKPTPATINDPKAYEFFAGNTGFLGRARWSRHLADAKPIAEWNNHMGCVTMTYNAPQKRYLLCVTDGGNTVGTYDTYILESKSITGPWKLVTYLKEFGKEGYFVNFPSKFIGADGRTAWLCYSANFAHQNDPAWMNPPGSKYAMCLQEIKLKDKRHAHE